MSSDFASIPVLALAIAGVVALVLTSFLSAVEIAFARLSRAFVQDLVDDEVRRAPALMELIEHRSSSNLALRWARATLQTVAIVSLTMALVGVFSEANLAWWAATLVALIGIGVLELLAVSLLPYFLVERNYVGVALAGTGMTRRLVKLLRRVRRFAPGQAPVPHESTEQRLVVADDLREIVDEVGETESIDEDDKEMLRSVFELGQTLVREVMVPRTSMVTIEADQPVSEGLRLFVRSGFSRIPVVGEDIDDVVGILYFKDVVSRLLDHPDFAESPLRNAVRTPVFIPEMRLADDELRAMQSSNTHLALVVDEYGGIAGLVTMEDLLEELVGELTDEHDRFEMEPEQLRPDTWRVPARFPLSDLADLCDIEIDEESVDSVGGLLAMGLGSVPLPGQSTTIAGLSLAAEEAVGRRHEVVSIVVQRLGESPEGKME